MKKWVTVIFVLLLGGCSSKLAYNNLDWLVYWYMDDYIELNNRQEAMFDKQLDNWIDWHRSKELPAYINHLKLVKEDLAENRLTEQRLLSHYTKATEHWQRLREEITPPLASMAGELSDEQVIRLFAALEKDNKETEEKIEETNEWSEQERMEDRVESLEEDMEERIGRLTEEQKQLIQDMAPGFMPSRELWLAYRRDLQQRARVLFAGRKNNPEFTEQLTALMLNPEQYRSEAFLQVWRNNRQQHARLASSVASSLTAKQKGKLEDEINDMIASLEDLLDE